MCFSWPRAGVASQPRTVDSVLGAPGDAREQDLALVRSEDDDAKLDCVVVSWLVRFARGMSGGGTVDVDESSAVADESFGCPQHVPQANAEPNLLDHLRRVCQDFCRPGSRTGVP